MIQTYKKKMRWEKRKRWENSLAYFNFYFQIVYQKCKEGNQKLNNFYGVAEAINPNTLLALITPALI